MLAPTIDAGPARSYPITKVVRAGRTRHAVQVPAGDRKGPHAKDQCRVQSRPTQTDPKGHLSVFSCTRAAGHHGRHAQINYWAEGAVRAVWGEDEHAERRKRAKKVSADEAFRRLADHLMAELYRKVTAA